MVVSRRGYATWGQRAGALLVDQLFAMVVVLAAMALLAIPFLVVFAMVGEEPSPLAFGGLLIAAAVVYAAATAAIYWNIGWRQGRTGQSLGKQAVGIEVVWEDSGQHLMAGSGLLRAFLAGIVSGGTLIGYLWPLWDDRNRTFHDLILKTLVVRCSPTPVVGQPFQPAPNVQPQVPPPPTGSGWPGASEQGSGGAYPPPP